MKELPCPLRPPPTPRKDQEGPQMARTWGGVRGLRVEVVLGLSGMFWNREGLCKRCARI